MLSLLSTYIFQNELFQKILSGTISVSNGLNPDQDHLSVGPNLDPNCLQMFSADNNGHR